MFYGNDPDGKGYSTRAHLAEVIGMLGPPPTDLLKRGIRSHLFFSEDGEHNSLPLNVYHSEEASNDLLCRSMESRCGRTARYELGAV